jgi:large-conductance mechanosensitive channel
MNGDSAVMTFAIAIYIGTALSNFFNSLTKEFLLPILGGIFPGAELTASGLHVQIGSVPVNIGAVIVATFNLAIAYIVVSFTLPYIRTYAPLGGRR